MTRHQLDLLPKAILLAALWRHVDGCGHGNVSIKLLARETQMDIYTVATLLTGMHLDREIVIHGDPQTFVRYLIPAEQEFRA